MFENLSDTQLGLALVALVGGGYYISKNPGILPKNNLIPIAIVASLVLFYVNKNKESFNNKSKRSKRGRRVYEHMENQGGKVTEDSAAGNGSSNPSAPAGSSAPASSDPNADDLSTPLAQGASLDGRTTDANINARKDCVGEGCAKRLTSGDLLPGDDVWGNTPSLGDVSEGLKTKNFLSSGYHVGVDTIGSSLRNANYGLRSDVFIPKIENLSPWHNSSIQADTTRRPLEIGN